MDRLEMVNGQSLVKLYFSRLSLSFIAVIDFTTPASNQHILACLSRTSPVMMAGLGPAQKTVSAPPGQSIRRSNKLKLNA